jgi:hypothetical protein
MNVTSTREGIGIALDALRSNKVRAFLTILGIVIGVATVMSMAAVITGFRAMVMEGIEAIGPNNFIASRFDPTALTFSGDGQDPTEGKPPLTFADAEMLEALPAVRTVATSIDAGGEVRMGSRAVSGVQIMGRSSDWVEYSKGDFLRGNNYLAVHDQRASNVAVLSPDLAEQLFAGADPVGRTVRIKGREFRVAGVYKLKDNIFASAMKNWAVVPATTAIKDLGANKEWMDFLVVTERGFTQERAMDDVTAALRSARGLRPAEENNFALIKQEAFKQMFDRPHRRLLHRDGGALVDRPDRGRRGRGGDHDDLGDGAHARDRRAQGAGRQGQRDPLAVPGGVGHRDGDRRRHRAGGGHRVRRADHGADAGQRHHPALGDLCVDHGLGRRGDRVRAVPGEQGRAAGPGGGAAARVGPHPQRRSATHPPPPKLPGGGGLRLGVGGGIFGRSRVTCFPQRDLDT